MGNTGLNGCTSITGHKIMGNTGLAVLSITSGDIQEDTGSVQLCAWQTSGVEVSVHAARESFYWNKTEAALLVDASNTFSCLNRNTALCNIHFLCPSLATILINNYRAPTELLIDGGKFNLLPEGTQH